MFFTKMRKAWDHRTHTFTDRRPKHRKAQQRQRLILESLEDRTLLSAAWTAIGPAPISDGQTAGGGAVSGRVTGIAADPNNASVVYIATGGGGIWKTTDAYDATPHWVPLTDSLAGNNGTTPLPVSMGAIAETDDQNGNQIVYAGMGEADNSSDSFYGDGILVSKNGGSTWSWYTGPNNAFVGETFAKIVLDPSDPTGGTAYAAVDSNGTNGGSSHNAGGVYETTDFGNTWTNLTQNLGLGTTDTFSDLVIDPHSPTNLYFAVGNQDGGGSATSGNYNGVYHLTVTNPTTYQDTLLSNCPNGTQDGRITLALYDDGTTQELFASIADPSTGGLYKMEKSTDFVNFTFTDITNAPGLTNYLNNQGFYDTTLAIDPTNANYVYVGGDQSQQGYDNNNNYTGVFSGSPLESINGGASWTDITTDAAGNGPHSDDHAVAFDAKGNLLDGNDGGIFRLNSPFTNSQAWSDLNTDLQITQFYGIAVDPVSNVIYGGSQDNGTEKYTGSPALGWTRIAQGDGGFTQVDPSNHNRIELEHDKALSISNSGGTPTDTSGPTVGLDKNKNQIMHTIASPFTLDSSGGIYFGTDFLNFSNTQGNSWTQIGIPGTRANSNGFNPDDVPIDAVAVDPVNNNIVYTLANGKLSVTSNAQAGQNSVAWTTIVHGLAAAPDNSGHHDIAIDPSDGTGATVYVVNNIFTTSKQHVFKVVTNFNSGNANLTDISGNLPNEPVWSVAVSPDGKTVFAGTDVGVYSTSDGGTTWTRFGTGLPYVRVTDLEYVASQNKLYAATYGRGAWEISTVTAPVVTTNPTSQTITAGQSVSFTAAASGDPTPTVQWQYSSDGGKTWNNVGNGTTTTITFSNIASSWNGYEFEAVFTNSVGTATTSAATLTVQYAPTVTINPGSVTIVAPAAVIFTAAADGNPAPTVQWQVSSDGGKTFSNINGATSTTLTLSNVTAAMDGNEYQAVFTNSIGTATTSAVTLTVQYAPIVTTNPSNVTVTADQNPTFTAAGSADPTPTVQWQYSSDGGKTWSDVSGATSATLTTTPAQAAWNGYEFDAVFTNSIGTTTTAAAILTVQSAPTVTTQPANQTVTAGQTATFTAAAGGNPSPTVQWQVSSDGGNTWVNISGATSTTLSLLNVTPSMNGNEYRAIFTNNLGTAATLAANFTVDSAPTPPAPSPSAPAPVAPPALDVPPLLAFFDSLLGGVETINPNNGTETITDSLFGLSLLTATFDHTGHLVGVALLGIDVTFLFG